MLATVAKNSFFVFLARIVDVGSVFLLIFLIARYLKLAEFGDYGFITIFVTFFFSLGYVGISQITVREVAQNRALASRYLRASLFLRTWLSLLLASIIIGITLFIRHDTAGIFLAILMMTIAEFLSVCSFSFLDILTAHELMHYDTLSTLLYRLTSLGITLIVIQLKGSLWYLFLAMVLATVVKALFLFSVYLKKIKPARTAIRTANSDLRNLPSEALAPVDPNSIPLWQELGRQAAPIALAFLIMQAYMRTGVFFLRALSSPEQIAIFYAPLRLLFQVQLIPFALSMALFPVFSRAAKNGAQLENLVGQKEELTNLFIRAFKFSVILCIPVLVNFLLLAEPIIRLIFGAKFIAAVPCLQILMISFPVTFLELLMNNFLISIKRQKLILICNTLCLATNLLLNIFLIPTFHAVGASWATSIAYIVLFIAFFYFIREYTGTLPLLKTFTKPLIAGFGMAVVLYFTQNINWIIFGILSSVIYLMLIIAVKGVTPREIQTLKSIVRPIKSGPIND
jgi:O-antigen/teichoic acid export membrane protein